METASLDEVDPHEQTANMCGAEVAVAKALFSTYPPTNPHLLLRTARSLKQAGLEHIYRWCLAWLIEVEHVVGRMPGETQGIYEKAREQAIETGLIDD